MVAESEDSHVLVVTASREGDAPRPAERFGPQNLMQGILDRSTRLETVRLSFIPVHGRELQIFVDVDVQKPFAQISVGLRAVVEKLILELCGRTAVCG